MTKHESDIKKYRDIVVIFSAVRNWVTFIAALLGLNTRCVNAMHRNQEKNLTEYRETRTILCSMEGSPFENSRYSRNAKCQNNAEIEQQKKK